MMHGIIETDTEFPPEESEGKPVPVGRRPALSYTVKEDRVVFTSNGEERSAFVTFNPTKDPKTYDLIRDDGVLAVNGIRHWEDDDTIKVCAGDPGGERPTEFKTAPGSPNRIQFWNRKKP